MEGEEKLLIRLQAHLEAGHPLRGLDLAGNEEKSVRGFQFLTLKPLMVVLNSAEDNFGQNEAALAELSKRFPTIEYAGSFEMELSHLSDEEEIEAFLADIGITESARLRLTRTAYEILGSISFFTVGKDEVRAWNISQGDKALDAAATIHSDLARGFIRAECFSYDDFLACGGDEKAVKDARKFRLEGRDYVVKDGDMICIRFNV
jgi:ribosome-binding ATPase YchF (GTP1/OBG family)